MLCKVVLFFDDSDKNVQQKRQLQLHKTNKQQTDILMSVRAIVLPPTIHSRYVIYPPPAALVLARWLLIACPVFKNWPLFYLFIYFSNCQSVKTAVRKL